jgi:hypothetical protein
VSLRVTLHVLLGKITRLIVAAMQWRGCQSCRDHPFVAAMQEGSWGWRHDRRPTPEHTVVEVGGGGRPGACLLRKWANGRMTGLQLSNGRSIVTAWPELLPYIVRHSLICHRLNWFLVRQAGGELSRQRCGYGTAAGRAKRRAEKRLCWPVLLRNAAPCASHGLQQAPAWPSPCLASGQAAPPVQRAVLELG